VALFLSAKRGVFCPRVCCSGDEDTQELCSVLMKTIVTILIFIFTMDSAKGACFQRILSLKSIRKIANETKPFRSNVTDKFREFSNLYKDFDIRLSNLNQRIYAIDPKGGVALSFANENCIAEFIHEEACLIKLCNDPSFGIIKQMTLEELEIIIKEKETLGEDKIKKELLAFAQGFNNLIKANDYCDVVSEYLNNNLKTVLACRAILSFKSHPDAKLVKIIKLLSRYDNFVLVTESGEKHILFSFEHQIILRKRLSRNAILSTVIRDINLSDTADQSSWYNW
jgi:hypothetical protein